MAEPADGTPNDLRVSSDSFGEEDHSAEDQWTCWFTLQDRPWDGSPERKFQSRGETHLLMLLLPIVKGEALDSGPWTGEKLSEKLGARCPVISACISLRLQREDGTEDQGVQGRWFPRETRKTGLGQLMTMTANAHLLITMPGTVWSPVTHLHIQSSFQHYYFFPFTYERIKPWRSQVIFWSSPSSWMGDLGTDY